MMAAGDQTMVTNSGGFKEAAVGKGQIAHQALQNSMKNLSTALKDANDAFEKTTPAALPPMRALAEDRTASVDSTSLEHNLADSSAAHLQRLCSTHSEESGSESDGETEEFSGPPKDIEEMVEVKRQALTVITAEELMAKHKLEVLRPEFFDELSEFEKELLQVQALQEKSGELRGNNTRETCKTRSPEQMKPIPAAKISTSPAAKMAASPAAKIATSPAGKMATSLAGKIPDLAKSPSSSTTCPPRSPSNIKSASKAPVSPIVSRNAKASDTGSPPRSPSKSPSGSFSAGSARTLVVKLKPSV